MKRIILLSAILFFFSLNIFSQSIPEEINYQGVLKNAAGSSIQDSSYTMVFKIYDQPIGGTPLWIETQNVPVSGGLFNVILGSVTPLTTVTFDRELYLGITVGSGSELSPRTALIPVPYSLMSLNVADNSITANKIKDGAVTKSKLGSDVIIPSGGSGKINQVIAGNGLTGGGDSSSVTLNAGAGKGISVSADSISLNTDFTDARYVNEGQLNSISTNMITPNIISSLNGISNDGGNIDLIAGKNITITPNALTKAITISSLSAGDNLGNHTATENINLNGHWLSGNGGSEGVYVDTSGNVGIGTSLPLSKLDVNGNIRTGADGSGGSLTLASLDNVNKGGQINWKGAGQYDAWSQNIFQNNMMFTTNSANMNTLQISNLGSGSAGLSVQGNVGIGSDVTTDSKMSITGNNSTLYALNVTGGTSSSIRTQWNGSGLGAALVCVNNGTDGDAIQILANGSGRSGMYTRGSPNVDYLIYADANGSKWAGYFAGNVFVNGTLSKSAGAFKIDDPIDPANKYLYHSFVESPDMKDMYDGIAVMDNSGEAVVKLPDWFEALNMDFRYQLTCIGGFAPVYIAKEITGNQFTIAGGKPGMKVSWMVTGIRHDPYAENNRIPVEVMKSPENRGKYLHPEDYGLPATSGINYLAPVGTKQN